VSDVHVVTIAVATVGAVVAGLLAAGAGPLVRRWTEERGASRDRAVRVAVIATLSVLWAGAAVATAGRSGRLPTALLIVALPLVAVVGVAALVDLETRRIPDALTLPSAGAISAAAIVVALASTAVEVRDVLIGAIVVPLTLEGLAVAARVVVGSRGVGRGDVKLGASIGPVLGGVGSYALVGLALVTLMLALAPALRARLRSGPRATIALAPALAGATVVVLIGGRPLASALEWLLVG
jgi:leader peptidase (prepilin peptidase)/N-methyltransferase